MFEALISLVLLVGFFVLLPLVLLGAALKLLVALVWLPFRLIGAALHVVFAVVGGVLTALFSVAGVLGVLLLGVLLLVALPLLPLLLLGGFVWAVVQGASGPSSRGSGLELTHPSGGGQVLSQRTCPDAVASGPTLPRKA